MHTFVEFELNLYTNAHRATEKNLTIYQTRWQQYGKEKRQKDNINIPLIPSLRIKHYKASTFISEQPY